MKSKWMEEWSEKYLSMKHCNSEGGATNSELIAQPWPNFKDLP